MAIDMSKANDTMLIHLFFLKTGIGIPNVNNTINHLASNSSVGMCMYAWCEHGV